MLGSASARSRTKWVPDHGAWAGRRDAELLAMEAGCEVCCEREVDEAKWQGGRVYLHLGARRDDYAAPLVIWWRPPSWLAKSTVPTWWQPLWQPSRSHPIVRPITCWTTPLT